MLLASVTGNAIIDRAYQQQPHIDTHYIVRGPEVREHFITEQPSEFPHHIEADLRYSMKTI